MFKILFIIATVVSSLFAIEVSGTDKVETGITTEMTEENNSLKVFGHNLFNGSFSQSAQHRFNPNYLISIGDSINIKMWGAFELETSTVVDSQGNIFLSQIGTINILGVKNKSLSKRIEKAVKRVFKKNVYVYANLANYQPVSIFVTGAVNKPGLYEGLSSDSVIQFIDKAQGIDAESGSYRNITILRDNKTVKKIDLYKFLLKGSLGLFQFHMGDVVVVDAVSNYIEVTGDVKRPYRYELLKESVPLKTIVDAVLINPTATDVLITQYTIDRKEKVKKRSIKHSLNLKIFAGESIKFIPDYRPQSIEVKIGGEHKGSQNIVVDKGTSLEEVIKTIKLSSLSQIDAFQLFRKSVASSQKKLLEVQLKDLEAKTLTGGSMNTEEAVMRKQEAALVLDFIQRAKEIDFKGQIVINANTDLSEVLLEDGDEIYIPKKSHMVIVQGEVMLPGAQTYVSSMKFEDFIDSCGGYNYRADTDNVLLLKKNGKVVNYYEDENIIEPGDSILVLSEVETRYLTAIKDITQIIYQIAVGAAVILRY